MRPAWTALLRAFVQAVLLGAIAAAAPMLVVTGIIGTASILDGGPRGDGVIAPALYLMVLPLVVSLPVVLTASLIVGLPVTLLLKRWNRESAWAYAACGAVAGALIPLVGLLAAGAPSGYWTALLGVIGGAVTGWTWWFTARKPR